MKSNKIILTRDLLKEVDIFQQQLSLYNHSVLIEGKDYVKNGRNYVYYQSAVNTLLNYRQKAPNNFANDLKDEDGNSVKFGCEGDEVFES